MSTRACLCCVLSYEHRIPWSIPRVGCMVGFDAGLTLQTPLPHLCTIPTGFSVMMRKVVHHYTRAGVSTRTRICRRTQNSLPRCAPVLEKRASEALAILRMMPQGKRPSVPLPAAIPMGQIRQQRSRAPMAGHGEFLRCEPVSR